MTASESDILAMFDAITLPPRYDEDLSEEENDRIGEEECRDSRFAMRQLADVCEEVGLNDHAECLRAMLDCGTDRYKTVAAAMAKIGVLPVIRGKETPSMVNYICNGDIHNVAGVAVQALTGKGNDES